MKEEVRDGEVLQELQRGLEVDFAGRKFDVARGVLHDTYQQKGKGQGGEETYSSHEGFFLRLLKHSKRLLNPLVQFREGLLIVFHGRFFAAADAVNDAFGGVAAGLDLEN